MTNATECQRTETLARLASFCGLSPVEAVYVPATVEVFARTGGSAWPEIRMVNELFRNAELRDYFVEVIRKARLADFNAK